MPFSMEADEAAKAAGTPAPVAADANGARVLEVLGRFGRASAHAGAAAGRKLAEWYRAVDPDVPRHLAQIPLLSYTLLAPRRGEIVAGEPDGHPPLVFVHGLGGGRGDFLPMALYLWLGGRRRCYRIAFAKGHDVPAMSAALADFVRDVRQATGERRVDVVAHSLGGVVTRHALHTHRLSRVLGTVVTLGTPHHGTYAARFAGTDLTRALRPDSPLIRELNRRRWPRSVRGVSFWSESDLMILPAESAALKGTEAVEMTPFTHYSYLIEPKSWAAVQAALSTPA